MTLKSLTLKGFKSFPDNTQINFVQQLSAIVGPNGCGKSNIVDALRWVLSGSSLSNIRSQKNSDVIFGGSEQRQASANASVELLLSNEDNKFSGAFSQYNEIAISRKISEQGKGDYYINGTKSRKKDILSLLSGTGLGDNSYSIIEQGMVAKLVTAKPAELQLYIEEVAGIGQFHTNRKEAENRLKHTNDNLARVQDIILELQAQIVTLEQQATEASKYSDLKQQQDKLSCTLAVCQQQHKILKQAQLSKKIIELKTLHSQYLVQQADLQLKITQQQKLLDDYKIAIETQNNKLQNQRLQLELLIQKIAIQKQQDKQLEDNALLLDKKIHILGKEVNDFILPLRNTNIEINNLETEVKDIQWNELDLSHQQLTAEFDDWHQQAQQNKQNFQEISYRYRHSQKQISQIKTEIDQIKTNQQSTPQTEAQNLESIAKKHLSASDKINEINRQIEAKNSLEKNLKRLKLHCDTRMQIQTNQHNGITQAVQKNNNDITFTEKLINDSDNKNQGIASGKLLQTNIKVKPQWVAAFDKLFCEQWFFIDEILAHTNLTCNLYWQNKHNTPINKTHTQLLPLASCLLATCDLPDFCNYGFVLAEDKTINESRKLLQNNEWILLRNGDTTGRNWYKKAISQQKGILFYTEDLSALQNNKQQNLQIQMAINNKINIIKNQISKINTKQDLCKQAIIKLNQQKQESQQQLHQVEIARTKNEQKNKQAELFQQQLIAKNTQYEQALAEHENLAITLKNNSFDEATFNNETQFRQAKIKSLNDEIKNIKTKKYKLSDILRNKKQSLQLMQQKSEATEKSYELLQAQRAEIKKPATINYEDLTQQQLELSQDKINSETLLKKTQQEQKTSTENHNKLTQELTVCSNQERKLDTQIKTTQIELDISLENSEKDENLYKKYNLNEDDIQKIIKENKQSNQAQQKQLKTIENKIEAIGAVNLLALKELEEKQQRLDETKNQCDDIYKAVENLQQAIRNIEKEVSIRFHNTVDTINFNLLDIYKSMFNGGKCQLHKLPDGEGIEIQAQLPGKKISALRVLSGGEKALTSIALIFAIFKLNPAPFCVLDEVDAPLDDTNAIILGNMIEAYADKLKFVVVTHNKLMMAKMQNLLGVTMAEAGVSRVVAVNIEQALNWQKTGENK